MRANNNSKSIASAVAIILIAILLTCSCTQNGDADKKSYTDYINEAKTLLSKVDAKSSEYTSIIGKLKTVTKDNSYYIEAQNLLILLSAKNSEAEKIENAKNEEKMKADKIAEEERKANIALGKSIFQQAVNKYSSNAAWISADAIGSSAAHAALFIPAKVWDKLTVEKQHSLEVYIHSMIPYMRKNPDKYLVGFSKDAPMYGKLRSNIQNLDGYIIMTTINYGGKWGIDRTVARL